MQNKSRQQFQRGFTLIELLVVISIISLLATMAVTSLKNAQKKARDAKRMADINQLQKALDLYYDQYNTFPASDPCSGDEPNTSWCNSIQSLVGDNWVGLGAPLDEFMAIEPLDPKPTAVATWPPSGGGTYFYYSGGWHGCTAGQAYMIVYGLENENSDLEDQDGVYWCDGYFQDYGPNASDRIITVGRNNQN